MCGSSQQCPYPTHEPCSILLEIPVLVDTLLINNFGFETPRVGMDIFWNHTFGSEIDRGFKKTDQLTVPSVNFHCAANQIAC